MTSGDPGHTPVGITSPGPKTAGITNWPAGNSVFPATPRAPISDRVKELEAELAAARREIANRRKREKSEEVELIDLYLRRLNGGSLHVYALRGRRLLTNALLDYRRHLTEDEAEPTAAFRRKVDKVVSESLGFTY